MHANGVYVCVYGLWNGLPDFVLTVALESCPQACEKGASLSFAHYLYVLEKSDISCHQILTLVYMQRWRLKQLTKRTGRIIMFVYACGGSRNDTVEHCKI